MTRQEERLMRYLDQESDAAEVRDVEAWLAGSADARALLASFERVRDAVRAIGEDAGAGGDGIADAVLAALDAPAPASGVVATRARSDARPAGTRAAASRRWMSLAPALGLGLAAAAAVVVYFRPVPSRTAPVARSTASTAFVQVSPAAELSAAEPAPVAVAEPGASIESVDFGAHAGTIFMVSAGSDPDEAETPVVWLMDEVAPTKGRMAPL